MTTAARQLPAVGETRTLFPIDTDARHLHGEAVLVDRILDEPDRLRDGAVLPMISVTVVATGVQHDVWPDELS